MEHILAEKIEELSKDELIEVLTRLLMQDSEAFDSLQEAIEAIL